MRRNRFILVALSAILTFVALQAFVGRERIYGERYGWHGHWRNHHHSDHHDNHGDDKDRDSLKK